MDFGKIMWEKEKEDVKKDLKDPSESEKKGKEVKKHGIFPSFSEIGLPKLCIICLMGIVLMVLSLPQSLFSGKKDKKKENNQVVETSQTVADKAMDLYTKKEERRLTELLENVAGIGKVKVMLTLDSSEEKITLQDEENTEEDTRERDSTGGTRNNSNSHVNAQNILVENGEEKKPYVVRIQAPKIKGVLVVAEGAGSSEKKEEIINAVQALFDIEIHRIVVMKME